MQQATVIVGIGFTAQGLTITNQDYRQNLVDNLAARTFGGYTVLTSSGGWMSPKGLVTEQGLTYLIGYENESDVIAFTKSVRRIFDQESVMFTVNNEVKFQIS